MPTNFQTRSLSVITFLLFYFCCLPSFGQTSTQSATNKKTVTQYFDEVINGQKLERMGAYFSSDYTWHQMNGTDTRSSQDSAHISQLRWLFAAAPDGHYAIDHVVAEEDMVAINTIFTGNVKPEMFGLPAGKKKVKVKQMFFFRLKNNKIIEEWEVLDGSTLMDQLKK